MINQIRYAIIILAIIIAGCSDTQQQDSSIKKTELKSTKQSDAPLPAYVEINRNIHDSKIKTLFELNAVVSDTITETGLRQLLLNLHNEANTSGNFRYNKGEARLVYIYLFPSLEHYESGNAQWIAMLKREGTEAPVDITMRAEIFPYLPSKPENKYGLTESKRMEIFRASITAEDRADKEAERIYPLSYPQTPKQTILKKKVELM